MSFFSRLQPGPYIAQAGPGVIEQRRTPERKFLKISRNLTQMFTIFREFLIMRSHFLLTFISVDLYFFFISYLHQNNDRLRLNTKNIVRMTFVVTSQSIRAPATKQGPEAAYPFSPGLYTSDLSQVIFRLNSFFKAPILSFE